MPYFINLQNKLFHSSELSFEEMMKLDKFLLLLEESGVGKIIEEPNKTDRSKGGRNPYNPYRLFATIIYGFSKHSGSLRKIEESINFDLRFIYLMDNFKPTHVTISKFLNNIVVKFQQEIFISITKTIIDKYNICIDNVSAEIMLVCLGYNIRKLFLLLSNKAKLDYWVAPIDLQSESLPIPNFKKILKIKSKKKGKNASLRTSYKHKKGR